MSTRPDLGHDACVSGTEDKQQETVSGSLIHLGTIGGKEWGCTTPKDGIECCLH